MKIEIIRTIAGFIAALLIAPLLPGIINKVKAFFAGRKGPRVFQLYFDLGKLARKESVISATSGGIVKAVPTLTLAFTLMALLFLPVSGTLSPLSFNGDVLLFFYFLGSCRILSVLAALDTGSSFEGMGSARELFFSALAEAALFAVLAFLTIFSGKYTLAGMLCFRGLESWVTFTPVLLVVISLFIIMLAENCRVPFDDPETHLELTMIHEAMILDYAGFDLGTILYSSALKLWIFAVLITSLLIPAGVLPLWGEIAAMAGGVLLTTVLVGVVESSMARYRFLKVPPLLIAAAVLPVLAIFITIFFGGGVK